VLDDVLKALVTSNGTGCPFLKLVLENPSDYNIRPQLLDEFLTHIYRTMWDTLEPLRKKIRLYVYHNINAGESFDGGGGLEDPTSSKGLPREAAWIDIVSDKVCWKEKRVASFPAFSEDVSILINHPQAVELLHTEAAKFIKGMTGGAVPTTEILPKLQDKYQVWETKTKQKLASTQGLPVFEVKISVGSGTSGGVGGESEEKKKEKKKEEKKEEKEQKKTGGVDPKMFTVGPLPGEEE
jgi:hypothetical protein